MMTKKRLARVTNGRTAAANGCGASTRIASNPRHAGGESLDGFLRQRKGVVVTLGQLDDRDPVDPRAGNRRSDAGRIEITHRLEEHGDAAPSGQIRVDDGDVSFLAHRARQLAAERRRAGTAL